MILWVEPQALISNTTSFPIATKERGRESHKASLIIRYKKRAMG